MWIVKKVNKLINCNDETLNISVLEFLKYIDILVRIIHRNIHLYWQRLNVFKRQFYMEFKRLRCKKAEFM